MYLFKYFRTNERLKNNLIEALSRKGAAMCQLYYFHHILNKEVDEDNKALQAINTVWVQITCFVSPDSDSKVCSNILILVLNF